jgi:uncharacterized protein (TIRG00374 family)
MTSSQQPKVNHTRDHLLNGVKILVGLTLLFFLYSRLEDPQLLWQKTLDANRWMLLLAVGSHGLAVALSALKWGVLLRAQHVSVTVRRLLRYQWMAVFFDNFFPAQLGGDVLRGYSLGRDTQRRADAAASVIIDRFTGLTAFMLAAAVSSVSVLLISGPPIPSSSEDLRFLSFIDLRLIALGSGSISLALLTAFSLMLSRRLKRSAEGIIARLPLGDRILPIWQKLAEAINAYRQSYLALAIASLGSLMIVVITSMTIWLLANAIIPGSISFIEVLVINPIIAFLGMIPISPGGLGVRQVVFAALFVTVGVSAELGFFVGVLQQLITYLVSLPGLWFWVRDRRDQRPVQGAALHPDAQAQ